MNEPINQSKGISLIYLRVSTEKQADKGIALPTQQDACFKCAQENDYTFNEQTDIYEDRGESARTMDRPALLDMLNRCEADKSVKAIIVYDLSRLARNRDDFSLIKVALRKNGIKLISATEGVDDSPEGQMLEGVLSSIAEFFSAQHGRRVKNNLIRKVKDGGWPRLAPFGYKNVQEKASTGKVKAWIEINWDEARWVTRAFELFATGNYSSRSLTDQLAGEGFPVRPYKNNVNTLHYGYLERMLRDKFYIGVLEWNGIVNEEGKHELFLDRALFDKVQAVIQSRTGSISRQRRLFSVLKSLSVCDECHSKMTSEEKTMKSGKVWRYLRCTKAQHHKKVECDQAYYYESDYEKQFAKLLNTLHLPEATTDKLRTKVKGLFADEQQVYEKARKDILGQIEGIKRQKKNLVLQLVDKDKASQNDMELYHTIMADLDADERRQQAELGKVESKIAGVVRTVEIALSLTVSCAYAFEKAKEPQLKALLARTLFKQLYMRDGQIVRAVLQEPLDYLCYNRIKKNPVFYQDLLGGSGGDRTHDKWLKRPLLYRLSYRPAAEFLRFLDILAYWLLFFNPPYVTISLCYWKLSLIFRILNC